MKTLAKLSLIALGAIGVTFLGCSKDNPTESSNTRKLDNDFIASIDVATQSDTIMPSDAVPDPEGNVIYFAATGPAGNGVFRVPATMSGGEVVQFAIGAPFVAPRGIAIGTDGKQVYVADALAASASGYQTPSTNSPPAGGILVATGDGSVRFVNGTQGSAPQGLEVAKEGNSDVIYFTGKDPNDGQPAVFKIPADGASAPTVVAKDSRFRSPNGVAVTKAGVIHVTDRAAAGGILGTVFRVQGTKITSIANDVRLGDPAGVTLTLDESVLLVSSLDRNQGTAQALLIDLASLETGVVNKVIGANKAAGGSHRAHNKDLFAWSGCFGDGSVRNIGRVYVIRP